MSTSPVTTQGRGGPRWVVVAAVTVAVVAVAVVVWLLVGGSGDDAAAPEPSPASGTSAPPSPAPPSPAPDTAGASPVPSPDTVSTVATDAATAAPTVTATVTAGVPLVVWHQREQDSPDGVRLVLVADRALAEVAGDGPLAAVRAALDTLLSTPAADPDHANPWAAGDGGGAVLDVREAESGGTVVDLPVEAFDGSVGSEGAALAVAALVRTVVSNGGEAPVTVLVDGEQGAEAWGVLSLDEPLEPDTADLAGGWVLDPYEGQRVPAGLLTVSGTATAFEANVLWEVLDEAGDQVDAGFTTAGANGEYGPFTFDTTLRPGSYTVRVYEESMAGPDEGVPVVWEDTTRVEVVG
ncbi:Gmad2 immunoglobulin-like domain-containing protein [Aquipuribacter sp. SD81]|uniref:Gmad2 immunoglobulin-like domain-containing protein n=1 Tax=Aquipuribacter sp. SD81 TaxID=3127703 RepID=UPI003018E049